MVPKNTFEKEYYESSTFWEDGVLGKADQIRFEETAKLIPADVKSLLDVGCGNGLFCKLIKFSKKGLNVCGVDRSQAAISHVVTNKVIGSITNVPVSDNSFDCVSCLEVLEHLPVQDYKEALGELSRIAAKYIIISVPYNEKIEENVTKCPECKSIFNVDLHVRSYKKNDILSLFNGSGYSFVESRNVIKAEVYVGYEIFLWIKDIIYRKKSSFQSPICPVCGYKDNTFMNSETNKKIDHTSNIALKILKKVFRIIKFILAPIWPKKKVEGYWIIALYKNDNNN